jgi:ABC-type transporter Mla subunit MlaD
MAAELAPHEKQISSLVDVAATTLDTFAAHSADVENTIGALPATLRQTKRTLSRVDTTSGKLNSLVDDVRPGAAKLAALATSAGPTLAALRPTARMGAQVAHT